ncbi:MAG TPA: hypothetical protein VNY05_23165, partial [Candidatus Acidoferrales bacterium]|nr:hypothetical protein [Candidatus Acidoferrales bacterium]
MVCFAGTETISRTPGALKITWLPPRPGLRHSTEILFCHRLQFFDAPAHIILALLLKSLAGSQNRYDTAFGITNTQSGILCDPASLVLDGRYQASSRPHARSGKGESRRTLSEPFSRFESKLVYNPHMQGIPRSTIALGSLLLISACLKGGQEVKSPQPEKSKPPVKMEQRGRILGIGGVFFKSANRDQMREWYSKHLGLA